MPADETLSLSPTPNGRGFTLNDTNVVTATVPQGEIWYVDSVHTIPGASVRAAVHHKPLRTPPQTIFSADSGDFVTNAGANDAGDKLIHSRSGGPTAHVYDRAGTNILTAFENVSSTNSGRAATMDGDIPIAGVSSGIVYVGNPDGSLNYDVSVANDVSAIETTPSTYYVGGKEGTVTAIDASTGTKEWSTTVGAPSYRGVTDIEVSPDESTVYVSSEYVAALNASDGTVIWDDTTATTRALLMTDTEEVFTVGDSVEERDITDGSIVSTTDLRVSATHAGALIDGESSAVLVESSSTLYGISMSDFSILWEVSGGTEIERSSIQKTADGFTYAEVGGYMYSMATQSVTGSGRSVSGTGTQTLGEYAYGGDTVAAAAHLPAAGPPVELAVRGVL